MGWVGRAIIMGSVLISSLVNADNGEREPTAVKVAGVFLPELSEAMTREMNQDSMVVIKVCGVNSCSAMVR